MLLHLCLRAPTIKKNHQQLKEVTMKACKYLHHGRWEKARFETIHPACLTQFPVTHPPTHSCPIVTRHKFRRTPNRYCFQGKAGCILGKLAATSAVTAEALPTLYNFSTHLYIYAFNTCSFQGTQLPCLGGRSPEGHAHLPARERN